MRILNKSNEVKTTMESDINRLGIALIGYLFITSVVSLLAIFITGADINGGVYIVASVAGLAFISVMYRHDFNVSDILEETREIPPKVFLNAFVVVIGAQPVFQLMGQLIERLFMEFNYEITYATVAAGATGSFLIMLNMVLIRPIVEEIIFRGLLLRSLANYGRNFAIVASSLLFGMYHASLLQNGYAFAAGIVLAYITTRYSIKWSVIIHCTNNMLMMIIGLLSIPQEINYVFFGIFFIWGVAILFLKRKKLYRYFSDGRSLKNAYKHTFTNIYVLAFLALTMVLTFMDITLTSIYE